ncbi:MAG: hypothetical protein JO144_09020, partial [Actinobacteria bacterium]|nr:hypothetical protein [Actinomycetota bacterium]
MQADAPRRSTGRDTEPLWLPWLAGLAMALAVLVLTQFAIRLLRHPMLAGGAWWPAAGLSLAVLARSPRSWWPQLVTGMVVSSAVSRMVVGIAPQVNLFFTAANVIECVIAALFLTAGPAHRSRPLAGVADGLRLIAGAVLGVSAAAAVVAVGYLTAGNPWLAGTVGYVLSHALGMVMLTPLLLVPT